MLDHIAIRHETSSDVADIESLIELAFREAPHRDGTEQFIVGELRRARALTVSLVAVLGDAICGHVAISPIAVSDGSQGWYGLGPLSVSPAHHRQGIGSRLMQQALSELRAAGAAGCVVLGDPAYYGRFGFRREPALVLPGVPQEYFRAAVFRGAAPSGTVSYHPAFGSTS